MIPVCSSSTLWYRPKPNFPQDVPTVDLKRAQPYKQKQPEELTMLKIDQERLQSS